jgi:hypothetical protein
MELSNFLCFYYIISKIRISNPLYCIVSLHTIAVVFCDYSLGEEGIIEIDIIAL